MQNGGNGIQAEESPRDPVIAIIGGVPVGITAGTLKGIDRSDADSWAD
jgi:hypothetical protein